MSKLGFDKMLRQVATCEKIALKSMMKEAQKEFKKNFDTESDAETKQKWDEVVRGAPPPILDVKGLLRSATLNPENVVIMPKKAVLKVDPIDERGRGYASFHQDGFEHLNAGWVAPRPFLTQSLELTNKQENILLDVFDGLLSGKGVKAVIS